MAEERSTVAVRMGRMAYDLTGPSSTVALLRDFFQGFLRDSMDGLDEPVVEVELFRGFTEEPSVEPLLRDEEGFALWQDGARWRVHWERGSLLGILDIVLHTALLHVLSIIVVERGGLLLHAAGIVVEGKAYVALGRSGAGKSTLAAMFPEEDVLNDEFVLVWKDGDEVQVASTPFFGSSMVERRGRYRVVPLRSFLTLVHGERGKLECSVSPLAPQLLTSTALPAEHHTLAFESSFTLGGTLERLTFCLNEVDTRQTLAV